MQKNRLPIIGLIVFGLLALGLTAMTLMSGTRTSDSTTNGNAIEVVATPTPAPIIKQIVAVTDIPPRTVITRSMLRQEDVSTPQPGVFTNMSDVVGRLASGPINAGQGVGSEMVTLPIRRIIPADFEIPAGLRAVAIYVDPSQTAAGLVDKGDRVDVIAAYKGTFEKQDTEDYTQIYTGRKDYTIGRTVAQDLLVLGVDSSLLAPPLPPTPAEGTQTTVGAGAAPVAATPTPVPSAAPAKIRVLLATTPLIAERLIAANDSGILHITIRNPSSREQGPITEAREYPIRVTNVRKKQAATAAPARVTAPESMPMPQIPSANTTLTPPLTPVTSTQPLAPSGSQVTVIRGTDKTNISVPTSP